LQNRRLRKEHRDGTPIPPDALIFSATGTHDVRWFLESGVATANALRVALENIGQPIDSFDRVYELGCGCGRVLRQWVHVDGPSFYASDYNPKGVQWAKENLGFVSFAVNKLEPPLPYQSEFFDFCYAISVFTHLPESMQRPWLLEMHRVLKPGGILAVTLSGEGDLTRITEDEQRRFRNGELIVVDEKFAGTNMCGVYHPESYVRRIWSDKFDIVSFLPKGAKGVPMQDLYILRRR
jgi:SAM-dependent methyltransferase